MSEQIEFFEVNVMGARIFHQEPRHLWGVVGLPPAYVALKGDRVLIVGEPPLDLIQIALGEGGPHRLHVTRHPVGSRTTGLLVDLTA